MPEISLEVDLTNKEVEKLQKKLKELGFFKRGVVDGILGSVTLKAVMDFQKKYGIDVDGIVESKTWKRLFPENTKEPTIKKKYNKRRTKAQALKEQQEELKKTKEKGKGLKDIKVPVENSGNLNYPASGGDGSVGAVDGGFGDSNFGPMININEPSASIDSSETVSNVPNDAPAKGSGKSPEKGKYTDALEKINEAKKNNETVLNLRSMRLDMLPEDIWQLKNLKELAISGNQLTELSSKIGQLTNLNVLDLAGNELDSLPSEIGQLKNLGMLLLYSNKLRTFPPEINKLTNLSVLDLSRNELSSLPPGIGELKNLSILFLNNNNLKTLPPEIDKLTYLRELFLKDNPLPPEVFERYKHLGASGSAGSGGGSPKYSIDASTTSPPPPTSSRKLTHSTYLLTWNPKLFLFERFTEVAQQVENKGEAVYIWSTGTRRNVSIGDRVFLMRQGKNNPGLVGSGWIDGDVRELEHWDEKRRNNGKKYNAAPIRWDNLGEHPILPLKELIEQTGVTEKWKTQAGGIEVEPKIAKHLEFAWENALARFSEPVTSLSDTASPLAWVETDAIPGITTDLSKYQPSKHDSLDADMQAKIFATLLVAEKVKPPFALALLGDWGIGKTFFMRLMQETVTTIAGKDAQAERNSQYVSRATQIEFNAWHYVDSDLWASLASRIFDGLSKELSDQDDEDKVADIRRRLRRAISSSKREQKEAAAAIETAQTDRQKATKKMEEKQAELSRVTINYESYRIKRFWDAVIKIKPDPNNQEQSNWPDIGKLRDKAQKIANQFGITGAIDSAEEVRQFYNSMRELSRRGGGLSAALTNDFTGGRIWLSGAVIAVALAFVVLWPWILEQVMSDSGVAKNITSGLLAPFLQLGTVVGPVVVWANKNLKLVSSGMSYLEKIQEELQKPRIELPDASEEEESLKKEVEECNTQIVTEQRRIEEAERQISEAQAEIQRINAGGLVYDFLEGRVRDSRYLDRLGLISVIRQDFEELGTLLRDWRKHDPNNNGQEMTQSEDTSEAAPIERIILYIDDLDRCPPKRVVEVLQAVHLLLAFDLFVVVVAVDARWLERALNESYNPWATAQKGSLPKEPMHRFNAHNYLEKIFQIPFSLPRMDEAGYRKLILKMIATPRTQAEENMTPDKILDAPETLGTPSGTDKEEDPMVHDEDKKIEINQPDIEEQPKAVKLTSLKQDELKEEERQKREQEQRQEQEEANKRIKTMLLNECEEQFIAALFHFIDTPRLAKRLVNIFRLLRVRAATINNDFSTFIDPDNGEYRVALMLLAISVGRADVAPEILDGLYTANGSSFRTWIDDKFSQYQKESSLLKDERIARNEKIKTIVPPSEREKRLLELQEASLEIRKGIDAVIKALGEQEGPPFDDQLGTYGKWAHEVGRYSFRWHLRAET